MIVTMRGDELLAQAIGNFTAQTRFERLDRSVVDAVKLRILDGLAAGLAGFHMGRHRQILPILGGAEEATTWGLGRRLSLRDAALFNAFVSHSLYLDDGSRFAGGHPSSVVTPSALALAERDHRPGRDLIAAVLVGYEVFLRLGRAIYPATVKKGFQATSVCGAASSAAACASLLGFDAEGAKNAVAIAGFMGLGIKEASKSSESQPLQVARSCEGGIVAALFAGQGAKGADTMMENGFLRAFAGEGADPKWLEQIGGDYLIGETYTKVHGGCRGNHAPVDVVQNMAREHGFGAQDVESIEVHVDSVTYAAEIHRPANGNQAQFSVGFACAAALVHGDASIFQYTDARLGEPAMQAMMGRIKVSINKDLDQFYPVLRPAEAVVTLKDGRRIEGYIDNAKGEPEHPFSPAEIEGKFLALTREALPGKGEQVRDVVMRLEQVNDVGELTRLLVRS